MTHAERNAAILRKIAAYTAKFTASQKVASDAIKREGLTVEKKASRPKIAA